MCKDLDEEEFVWAVFKWAFIDRPDVYKVKDHWEQAEQDYVDQLSDNSLEWLERLGVI